MRTGCHSNKVKQRAKMSGAAFRGQDLPLLQKVVRTVEKHRMLRKGDRVLVGVSGGADSICLLHAFVSLKDLFQCSLLVAHLHHGLRGDEADRHAEFVRRTAEALDLPFVSEKTDVSAYVRKERLSLQEGARRVRYAFFERVAVETGSSRIALGHTADDQAETLLMRLLRGAGPGGLGGIPPKRNIIIRPLIEVSRTEIMAYLSMQGYSYVVDSSNLRPIYLRNRVRLELLPFLKERYNPNLIDTLLRNADILREEDIWIENVASGMFPDLVVEESPDHLVLNSGRLQASPKPIQRRLIRIAVEKLTGEARLSYHQTESILSFLRPTEPPWNRAPLPLSLPSGLRVRHVPEGVSLSRLPEAETRQYPSEAQTLFPGMVRISSPDAAVEVALPGTTELPGSGTRIFTRILEGPLQRPEHPDTGVAFFDLEKFSLPIVVRNRRSGDLFYPSGMGGKRQKVKDFFTNRKIPRSLREAVPILSSPGGVLWIIGWRTDERFQATGKSLKIMEVRIEERQPSPDRSPESSGGTAPARG